MEKYQLNEDIKVMYIQATSFPEGVMAAHQQLHRLIKQTPDRKYYSVSYPNPDGSILYRAASAELNAGEAEIYNLPTYVIRKGSYHSIDIPDFMNNIPAIGDAFQKLIAEPDIDPKGACIEWYMDNDTVKCMVRMAD